MQKSVKVWPILIALILWVCAGAMTGCQFDVASAASSESEQSTTQQQPALVIENESELPDTYPRANCQVQFRARGGIPTLHWRLEKGTLPAGLQLEDGGLLHGQPEQTGEFQFTLSVRDGSQPPQAVQKGFVLRVKSALSLKWKDAAHVNSNRIEGSVEVTNTTPDDMDLTFIVLAVAANGRATAIGYQHFILRNRTIAKELPFAETLPHGGYVIHVDAVGEVAARNLIYRDRLQSPGALQVTVGP